MYGIVLLVLDTGITYAAPVNYRVEIDAPRNLERLLKDNLEIYRVRKEALDLERLRSLYRKTAEEISTLAATEGYYSALIDESLTQEQAGWVARFNVRAGQPTRVSRIDLRFVGAIRDQAADVEPEIADLRAAFVLKSGAVFRQEAWEASKRGVLRRLVIQRYPAAKISASQALVDPAARTAALTVEIDSGPAFYFGKLNIQGLERYPRRVVENLNPITPGMPYSQKALLDYQTRLQNTGYFRGVSVSVDTNVAQAGSAPVRVTVDEYPSKRVALGAGLSTNTGVRGEINYSDHNIFDSGLRFDSDFRLETKEQLLSGELSLPTSAQGYIDSTGISLNRNDIENQITENLSIGAQREWGGERLERRVALQYLAERREAAGLPDEDSATLSLNYALTFRRTDDLLFPNDGYLLNLQFNAAAKPLLSDQTFLRSYAKGQVFFPFGPKDTVIVRGELGITAAESRDGIPAVFLFRTGGDQSVRGYAYQSLGVPAGDAIVEGRYVTVASGEYVHWLYPRWGAAAFYDVGSAFDDVDDAELFQGVGVGARWKSPVGPLAVDVAYGQETEEVRLHFSLGVRF